MAIAKRKALNIKIKVTFIVLFPVTSNEYHPLLSSSNVNEENLESIFKPPSLATQ